MRKFWWYKYKKAVYSGNKEEAKRLLLKAIPDGTVIYKYCRGKNRNWDTTTQSKLWLCRADQFNDPFDCAFLYNCKSKEVYDKKTEYEIAVKENMEQLKRDKISKDLQQSVFISCFSEKCDSLLMWSHYADEHKGICIGFDLRTLIQKYNFFPVIYSNEMPQEKKIDFENEASLYGSILTKSKEWSYEHEWRFIDIDKSFSDKEGKEIPFEKPIEICLGKRQEDGIAANHKKYNSINKEVSPIEKLDMFQADDSYVDINHIIDYAKKEKVRLFDFDLSKKEFRLYRRKYLV